MARSASFLVLSAAALLAVPGCTALQELAALRSVTFSFTSVSDVRLAGIPVGPRSAYSRLGSTDVARLGAAILSRQVPIDLVAHVAARNPAENKVAARLVGLSWTLFVEDRKALEGGLANAVVLSPGVTADVPLAMSFDLLELSNGGARDLFDLALGIAGSGTVARDLRLELSPTVDTSLGPIRYPSPIVVRRAADAR